MSVRDDHDSPPLGDDDAPYPDHLAGQLRGAADVAQYVRRQWGDSLRATGVIHGASIWRRDPRTHLTLRLGPSAPTSVHDTLALGVARARADAIVTTGRILRAEPGVRHDLPTVGNMAKALGAWRREILGKLTEPVSLVLTRGHDVDLDAPFFASPGRKVLYTDRQGAFRLESRALGVGAEIAVAEAPSPAHAVEFLRAAFGAATILIEAGPSVARQLYGDAETPALIDEVMLSIFEGSQLPTAARGARQPPPDALHHVYGHPSPPYRVLSDDGPWSFVRYRR